MRFCISYAWKFLSQKYFIFPSANTPDTMTLLHYLSLPLSSSVFGLLFIFPFNLQTSSIFLVHHAVETPNVSSYTLFLHCQFYKNTRICCLYFLTSHFFLTTWTILSIVSTSLWKLLSWRCSKLVCPNWTFSLPPRLVFYVSYFC